MYELRDYQQDLMSKTIECKDKRKFVSLPTGGGKTIYFSHLANNYKGRVLIIVNRTELVDQTIKNINRTVATITSKDKDIYEADVTVAMVKTLDNRIKAGRFNLDEIDLIIIDEAHNLEFTKIVDNFNGEVVAVSATPSIMKKSSFFKCKICESVQNEGVSCCNKEVEKYTRKVSLQQWYGNLIMGVTVDDLIEKGFLTPVFNFSSPTEGLSNLKTDSSGDYSKSSTDAVYNNKASTENLIANYKEHCLGKKTMVFNSSIKANNSAVEKFIELGFNARGYDSKSKENRKELVDWFKVTPDAILLSVGTFTTGFDVDDVENIILNLSTKSLSLYHQIVGRGGRITDKIDKPFFKLIDLGGNIEEFGSWCDPVDWRTIYEDSTEKKFKYIDTEDFDICHSCEAMIMNYPCEFCGAKKKAKKESSKITIAEADRPYPKPRAIHVLNYAISQGQTINEAKLSVAESILRRFKYMNTSKESYENNKDQLRDSIKKVVLPIYFKLHQSELEGIRKKTIESFLNQIFGKLNKYYE